MLKLHPAGTITLIQCWTNVAMYVEITFIFWLYMEVATTLKKGCKFNVEEVNVETTLKKYCTFNVEQFYVETTLNFSWSTSQPKFNPLSTLNQRCVSAGYSQTDQFWLSEHIDQTFDCIHASWNINFSGYWHSFAVPLNRKKVFQNVFFY